MNDFMSIIEWWIVPFIQFSFLVYVLFVSPEEEAPPLVKASARSGKWAGLTVLALFIVSRKGLPDSISFTIPEYSFDYVSTIVATLVGCFLFLSFSKFRSMRFLGVLSFFLTTAISITIYSYFFIATLRSTIVFWSLGLTLGILLNRMLFPELPPAEVAEKTGPAGEHAPSK
ncbi:MAG: hypothetical protein WA705_25665 [Candidatus Ozemobacteraceae bacterium]